MEHQNLSNIQGEWINCPFPVYFSLEICYSMKYTDNIFGFSFAFAKTNKEGAGKWKFYIAAKVLASKSGQISQHILEVKRQ